MNSIQITDIKINGRDECRPGLPGDMLRFKNEDAAMRFLNHQPQIGDLHALLKVGDIIQASTWCPIVRVTIVTDQGSADYTLNGD
jgi:hypothetical protein